MKRFTIIYEHAEAHAALRLQAKNPYRAAFLAAEMLGQRSAGRIAKVEPWQIGPGVWRYGQARLDGSEAYYTVVARDA